MSTEIADKLERTHWDVLRALAAPLCARKPPGDAMIRDLANAGLLAVEHGRPTLTAQGRRVLVVGSPRLWNS